MARQLSRNARRWLILGAIVAGVGIAVPLLGKFDPSILPLTGAIGLALSVSFQRINGRRVRKAKQAAPLESGYRSAHPTNGNATRVTKKTATKAKCAFCDHVQTVPADQNRFTCEQCNTNLKRPPAPPVGS
jgi:hypothetical protein